jgi:hypothetical protein
MLYAGLNLKLFSLSLIRHREKFPIVNKCNGKGPFSVIDASMLAARTTILVTITSKMKIM